MGNTQNTAQTVDDDVVGSDGVNLLSPRAAPRTSQAVVEDNDAVVGDSVQLLSPRVVPLTSKRALLGAFTAANSKDNPVDVREERLENISGSCRESPSLCHERAVGGGTPLTEHKPDEESRENFRQPTRSSSGKGHYTTLVRHLGVALGRRGNEAYRRPGCGQPVWRKRETVIQERIVQYTTLDEQGTVSVFLCLLR